jgi:hypothetical protein
MPLSGGASAKFGDRYEGRWTVLQLANVIAERANSLRLEPPGSEGEGVEFWVRRGAGHAYHQVKRQTARGRGWSIDELSRTGVIENCLRRLAEDVSSFVFVSTESAGELSELTERARSATAWGEFRREFLKSGQARTNFAKLCAYVKEITDEDVFNRLRRLEVRTIDEATLQRLVESLLLPLVDGEPSAVAAILAQFVLDNVHREVTPPELWRHLESQRLRPRDWAKDNVVLQAIDRANALYLQRLREQTIGGHVLPRAETDAVLEMLRGDISPGGVVLVGDAGVGKSGVSLQVLEHLGSRNVSLLAFRVDLLEPVVLPRDAGRQLGLPDSPAAVLAAIASGRPSVLVIDQLDAVSLASGRNPQFFQCFEEMIRQARSYAGMKVIIVGRRFDLENDRRFAALVQPSTGFAIVTVERLSRDVVVDMLRRLGLDPQRFHEKQLELLSVPLHLSLLADIVADRTIDPGAFETSKDLYDRFWDLKQTLVSLRVGRAVAWTPIIDALSRYMSEREMLAAPVPILDQYGPDAEAMVSERVLVRSGDRYGFFHEEFFDYCFARRFLGRGESLIPFLREREQHLFRRAQVRQILMHERDSDPGRYRADLQELLTCPDIRLHIKGVVQALLAELKDPTTEEWRVLAGLPRAAGAVVSDQVWRVIHGSGAWFRLLHSSGGVLQTWLSGEDDHVDRAVWFLRSVQRQAADEVADLLAPYVGRGETWNRRLVFIAQWSEPGAGERFVELFLRLIDLGVLDEARGPIAINSDFWSMIYGLPKTEPQWAARVIGHYLARRLEITIAAGGTNPFEGERSQVADRVFLESADGAPHAFVLEVLPVMLRIMALNTIRDGERPSRDHIWSYRQFGGGLGADDALLTAMERALAAIAKAAPAAFEAISQVLKESELESAQYLLIRAYTAGGVSFANEAADYLIAQTHRLETGYMSNRFWASRELLCAITPHCDEQRLRQLEDEVLAYYPRWERTIEGRRSHGYGQSVLLDGIEPTRRSDRVHRRLQELQRKFGRQQPPRKVEMVAVASPVPEVAGDKMTDEHWLAAIAKYSRGDMRERGAGLVGGVHELSRALEAHVKQEPVRFAALAVRFGDATPPEYFSAVLRGLSQASIKTEASAEVCRRAHRLPGRPCGREIADLVEKMDAAKVPEDILHILAWYATEDADPDPTIRKSEGLSGATRGRDVLGAGLNSVRGGAALAIARLLFDDNVLLPHVAPTLERMVQDPSVAVRACVATTLLSLLRHDRDLAVRLFQALAETEDDLLVTRDAEEFLRYGLQTHQSELLPIVERMLASNEANVRTAGARRATAFHLLTEGAPQLAERAFINDEALRLGAAQVYAANLSVPSFRERCAAALKGFFTDDSEEVRREAASFPRHLEGNVISEISDLIEDFLASPAFASDSFSLVHALEKAPARLPEATLLVCRRFIERVGLEAANIQSSIAMESSMVSRLLVRVYTQSRDDAFRSRCLDVIDRMVEVGAFGLADVLAATER